MVKRSIQSGSSRWQTLSHASCKPSPGPFLQWNLFLSSILKAAAMNTKASVQLCLSTEDCQRTRAHHLFKHRRLNYWRKEKKACSFPICSNILLECSTFKWSFLEHIKSNRSSNSDDWFLSDGFCMNLTKISWSIQMWRISLNLPERRSKVEESGRGAGGENKEIYSEFLYCVPSDNLCGGGGLGVYHSQAATPANTNQAGILSWKRCVDPLVKDL